MMTQLPATTTPPDPARAFATTLAAALRRHGAPAHRVEDQMAALSEALGRPLRFHVLPAAILASDGANTEVLDVAPRAPRLDRLDALERIADRVADGDLTPAAALSAIARGERAPSRYGRGATIAAYALASASAVGFFGGGPIEAVAAAGIGLVSGLLSMALGARPHAAHLVEVAAAAFAAFALGGLAHVVPLAGEIALVAGLIVLLPGFSLTMALTELATGHRVSGSAGLAAGALVLLELGFGTALGSQAAEAAFGPAAFSAPATTFPGWWTWPALLGVAVAFSVLLHARPAQIPQVIAACALALHAQMLGAWFVGPQLAGGIGALAVAVASRAMSRWRGQPAAVWQLPGTLLLVPGAVGFRSVTALLEHDVVGGVEGAFGTALAAMALVGGGLLGSALVPPRATRYTSAPEAACPSPRSSPAP